MTDGRWKLVAGYAGGGAPTLFDISEDRLERRNLAAEHPAEVQRLRRALEESA